MKVNITAALISKMNVLSSEYNVEVGGYLTGEIKNGEMCLDDLLIPDQRISAAAVEIDTSDQVNLFRKYRNRCRRIVGHWHSHHRMGCFWSATDLNNMSNIMQYKDLYVFVVSSQGNHKVKVCMKNPLNLEFDNCDLYLRTVMLDQVRMKMKNLMAENSFGNSEEPEITEENKEEESEDSNDVDDIERTGGVGIYG